MKTFKNSLHAIKRMSKSAESQSKSKSSNNIGTGACSLKDIGNQYSTNRIASRFNPDTLYNIKSLQSKSNTSCSILKTDNNDIRGKLSSV